MSPKSACAVALVAVMLMAVPMAIPAVSAAADGDYVSQLDANGTGLYEYLDARFLELEEDPVDTASFSYTLAEQPTFSTMEEAQEYAASFVSDTLAAYYLTNPAPIWLWDLPVTEVTVNPVVTAVSADDEGGAAYVLNGVSFSLTVPEGFEDDPDTEDNEISGYIAALSEAVTAYEGDDTADIVYAIAEALSGITSAEDDEGTVSSPYDALVDGVSSDAGVAAAFTLLCRASGVEAVTAMGQVVDSSAEEGHSTGYWNLVLMDDGWYAADLTLGGSEVTNGLLVGVSSSVTIGSSTYLFGGTRSSGIEMASTVSLSVPQIVYGGYEWPDDSSWLELYGAYVALVIMAIVIVAALVYAIRTGNV